MTEPRDGDLTVKVTPNMGEGTYTIDVLWPEPGHRGQLANVGPRDLSILRDAITEALEHR